MATNKKIPNFEKHLPYVLIVCGLIAFICAFTLGVEQVQTLRDPSHIPSCNISPIISCGSVMTKPQADAFGFPNPLMGIPVYAIFATIGVAILAGAKLKKWFWLLMQLGATGAIGFVIWLFFESLYRLGTICPYCFVIWMVTLPLFWYVTLHNLQAGNIKISPKLQKTWEFVRDHHGDFLILFYAIMLGLILHRFWFYWTSLV